MPPVRTVPAVKPVKTERTHEENQERAYIAASRRSDRSLEARIESARRASEIHKKRTGRALRVTEQDVVNEEMYEEEDEDLPAQYRRLTAHLQTGSMDFNRRFHAYLLSHHGTRSALANFDANGANPFMQYTNAPYFANPMMQSFAPHVTANAPQSNNTQPQTQSQMASPQISHASAGNRHTPYPPVNGQLHKSPQHQRSASIATPQELRNNSARSPLLQRTPTEELRRMSLPMQAMPSPSESTSSSQPSRPTLSHNPSSSSQTVESPQSISNAALQQQACDRYLSSSHNGSAPSISGSNVKQEQSSFSPLTTTLPAEAQMFLGPSLDIFDIRSSQLPGNDPYSNAFSAMYDDQFMKGKMASVTSAAMNQTLSLDMSTVESGLRNPSYCSDSTSEYPSGDPSIGNDIFFSPTSPTFDLNFDATVKPQDLMRNDSNQGSVGGDLSNDWTSLVQW